MVHEEFGDSIKLHVGCGKRIFEGWVNVDVVHNPAAPRAPDLLCPAHDIPLPSGSVVELTAIHVFEHFYVWEVPRVLAEWSRLMRPNALLVLEMPDLFKCCQNVLAHGAAHADRKDQFGMWGLYGDPQTEDVHMAHHWGWTFKSLAPVLQAHGFKNCRESLTQWHAMGRGVRDFRIEAQRI